MIEIDLGAVEWTDQAPMFPELEVSCAVVADSPHEVLVLLRHRQRPLNVAVMRYPIDIDRLLNEEGVRLGPGTAG